MLIWEKLLCDKRRKALAGVKTGKVRSGAGRNQFERDYDRILFATPTRRLADKTQVFPMEENDSVRTRLTHSHEVSNLARSIGIKLSFEYPEQVFGTHHEELEVKRSVPALLAAVGLAHDLGNPPFGHQGEASMQGWFKAREHIDSPEEDFLAFDGNAQTLRLLTRLQVLNDKFGYDLAIGTLAALVKYPTVYGTSGRCYKKHGVFQSERDVIDLVWSATGLSSGVRHPFAYVMEACDDIAYSIIDAEDTVKKGYASFNDLIDYLRSTNSKDPATREVLAASILKHKEFKQSGLSSKELNDISMQVFRAKAISVMITDAIQTFLGHASSMMNGTIDAKFEIIDNSRSAALCRATKQFDRRHGFQHRDVLYLELQGHNFIQQVMDILWDAINSANRSPYQRYVYEDISENYRRVFESSSKDGYAKRQLLCDAISGMTENHLIRKHAEFKALSSKD